MHSTLISNSRSSIGEYNIDFPRLPQQESQVQQVAGSIIISMPPKQDSADSPRNKEIKAEEIQIDNLSLLKKSKALKTISALSVDEEEALEKISEYKKKAIIAAAGFVPGLIVGSAVTVSAGPFWGVLAGVFCGGTCAAAARWKFMPHLVKIILTEEYEGNLNKLFENNLKQYLMNENQDLDKSYHGHLLLTAFKVNIPKRNEKPIFSLEEVKEFLEMDVFDSTPAEKHFNFWAGDIIGDFETTEKVNRATIAYYQGLIESLQEALEEYKSEFSKKDIDNIFEIIKRLKKKLPSCVKNLEKNYELVVETTEMCFKRRKKLIESFILHQVEITQIKPEHFSSVVSEGSSFGSLNTIRSLDFLKLDPAKNANFKRTALKGSFPPAWLIGEYKGKNFKRRIVDIPTFNEIQTIFSVEAGVRKAVIHYEMGEITKDALMDYVHDLLKEHPLPEDFKSVMKLHTYNTIERIDNHIKGYFKIGGEQ